MRGRQEAGPQIIVLTLSGRHSGPILAPLGPQLGLILKVAPILIPILAQELALAGLVGFPQSSGQTQARLVKLAKQVPVVNQY